MKKSIRNELLKAGARIRLKQVEKEREELLEIIGPEKGTDKKITKTAKKLREQ